MNYLTALIAFPIFNLLFIFEFLVWFRAPPIKNDLNRRISLAYIIVSFLQAVSCWFWFLGFYYSKLNNVFGEGFAPGEECNCFGLVGAEVLLSMYQWIMTSATAWQALTILLMSTSKHSSSKIRGGWLATYVMFVFLLAVYTGFAWTTAHNRRCPQGNKILEPFQHYFYPVFLCMDMILYAFTLRKVQKISAKLDQFAAHPVSSSISSQQNGSHPENTSPEASAQQPSPVPPSPTPSNRADSPSGRPILAPSPSTLGPQMGQHAAVMRQMRTTVRVYKRAFYVTMVTGVVGVIVFCVQYLAHVPAFSMIACLFCLAMYFGYVARRTPFLCMYCGYKVPSALMMGGLASSITGNGANESSALKSTRSPAPPSSDRVMAVARSTSFAATRGGNVAAAVASAHAASKAAVDAPSPA
ncbi:hypothetical protein AMAG_07815 [Allomyces macrogynus ATCC 38327]|uniref:Uncharacterized protein n=1 Tax=Allomyces macrogynus (strain ATCC 38327) TaxID=578462 RepID=A0A0L0SJD3_ALLM3|nr:hypothetical protein AMAG_07815 [Allomyces macrogynus ATCC 38327]|eukprot:KNE62613.1 hypothetical protein AMAG_07815 [Allomyces macrogynus ATCC 38327]